MTKRVPDALSRNSVTIIVHLRTLVLCVHFKPETDST